MKVLSTSIADVKVIEPKIHGDDRGFFMETFRENWFNQNVAKAQFVQNNFSRSKRHTLRGLHYQLNQTQGKLVSVTAGNIFDVAVDMRKGSKTCGKWVGVELSAENKRQLWVPEGFAHGFYVMSEYADFFYKCTDYYEPTSEIALRFDDSTISIDWPFLSDVSPFVSAKDQNGLLFNDAPLFD